MVATGSQRAALFAFTAIALAAFVNGFPFWLQRVGWLDIVPCESCTQNMVQQWKRMEVEESPFQRQRLAHEGSSWYAAAQFRSTGAQRYAKLAKDLAVLALLGVGIVLAAKAHQPWPARDWLLTGMLAVVVLSLLASTLRYDWPIVAAGGRAFSCLLIALFAGRLGDGRHLSLLARVLVWLLIIQLPLAFLELAGAERLFAGRVLGVLPWGRSVGTFVHPTGLGVFAVCTLLLYACFVRQSSGRLLLLAGAAGMLVMLSGSGTAVVLYSATVAWLLGRLVQRPVVRRVLFAVMVFTAVISLPWITGRHEIFTSAVGRLWGLGAFFASDMSLWAFLLGHGLGIGTNTLVSLAGEGLVQFQQLQFPRVLLESIDSTPLALTAQVGLIGVLLFYGLLIRSIRLDVAGRPLLLIVLVASTMINVLEFYPVNVMLGLLLARGVHGRVSHADTVNVVAAPHRTLAKSCP